MACRTAAALIHKWKYLKELHILELILLKSTSWSLFLWFPLPFGFCFWFKITQENQVLMIRYIWLQIQNMKIKLCKVIRNTILHLSYIIFYIWMRYHHIITAVRVFRFYVYLQVYTGKSKSRKILVNRVRAKKCWFCQENMFMRMQISLNTQFQS